jgi:hypothetical protein
LVHLVPATTVVTVNDVEYLGHCREVQARLRDLLRVSYGRTAGRDGSRIGLSQLEAGYGTMGAPWALGDVLARLNSDFQKEQLEARLDVLMADLLRYPEQAANEEWASRYGYASPVSLGRGFRNWYGVGVGDARRTGTLGRWLALAERHPQAISGRDRAAEAERRIRAFRGALLSRPGPQTRAALRELGRRQGAGASAPRPRYPGVGSLERARLSEVRGR